MKIINTFPPNIDLICTFLDVPTDATFAYGNIIYNPSGKELSQDIIQHEQIHERQQAESPDVWWAKYLSDRDFRLKEETQAYGMQYAFAQQHVKSRKLLEWAKESMALALSGAAYGKLCTYGEAESRIRNYATTQLDS